MQRSLPHHDFQKHCEFLKLDEKGHWQCRLLQFSGQPVAIVTLRGRINWATSLAHDILSRYWPEYHPLQSRLPRQIRQWMSKARKSAVARAGVAQGLAPLVIDHPPGRLVVRFLLDGTATALLFEENLFDLPVDRLRLLGLTPREAEVLLWLAQGKTIPEIAVILSISSRTVSKLLTRIYRQLGVENRHAAVATALEAVRAHTTSQQPRAK